MKRGSVLCYTFPRTFARATCILRLKPLADSNGQRVDNLRHHRVTEGAQTCGAVWLPADDARRLPLVLLMAWSGGPGPFS